jgi:hypothetical protein
MAKWQPGDPDPPGTIQPMDNPRDCLDCGTKACERHGVYEYPDDTLIARTKAEYRQHLNLYGEAFTELPVEELPDG